MRDPKCAMCNVKTLSRFVLCPKCRREYGPSKKWPQEVRQLVSDERRQRRQAKNRKGEVPYFEDEQIDDRYPSEIGLGYALEVCAGMMGIYEDDEFDHYDPPRDLNVSEEVGRVIDWNAPGYRWIDAATAEGGECQRN